jgi:CheY-like chemotaxis protein
LSIARSSFDLDELVADLLETTRPLAENKGLLIQSHVQDNVPRSLVGDQVRVRQILANLIDNAVKFTEQGTIYLRITVDERSRDSVLLRMVVTDTGVGIPPERQAVIFDSFAQADGSSTRHHGGLGLGLTICKQLADLMEGQIGFRSNAGSGTSFWVTLSFGLSAQTEKRAAPVARRQVGSAGSASDDAPDAAGDADFGDTPKTGRRPVVLVAEDDHLNQTLLEVLLTRAGCIVDIVGSGNEALELCLQHTVDLVFMDVEMPGMDGLEAIRRIRQQQPDGASRLPIVALTAQAMPGDRERCLESGADEYLPKPFTPEDLFGAVERQLPGLLASNEWESGGETAPNQPNLDQNNRSALERTRAMRRALESENYRQLENHAKALRKLGQQLEGSEVADQAMRVQLAARSGDARRVAAAVGRLQQAVEAQTGAPTTAAPENT